jgi:hypothetical protein
MLGIVIYPIAGIVTQLIFLIRRIIVKLKCVDRIGGAYLTKGKIYEGVENGEYYNITDDIHNPNQGYSCGRFEVVEGDKPMKTKIKMVKVKVKRKATVRPVKTNTELIEANCSLVLKISILEAELDLKRDLTERLWNSKGETVTQLIKIATIRHVLGKYKNKPEYRELFSDLAKQDIEV